MGSSQIYTSNEPPKAAVACTFGKNPSTEDIHIHCMDTHPDVVRVGPFHLIPYSSKKPYNLWQSCLTNALLEKCSKKGVIT